MENQDNQSVQNGKTNISSDYEWCFKFYEKVIEGRNFHYKNYNTWSNYYAIFNGALFIGYYTISNNCNCCDTANNNLSFLSFISCDERVPKSSRVKGMNKHLCHMYEILKDSKDYIV